MIWSRHFRTSCALGLMGRRPLMLLARRSFPLAALAVCLAAVVVASVSALVIALGLVARLCALGMAASEPARSVTACACAALLALAHRKLAAHATNGMDTGFAMTCATLLFLAWWRFLVSGAGSG